eukprot:TRINITY_DN7901_c0_g2_i4.p1 TRINITY_DN7901_c0_g2~~TRINITY_DN7901_c0_g2_i4.p1  ORF type:complete len:392 (-),score=77.47 TRINITY_DN7901_c0_g2_i4:8-1183(-)
MLGSEFPTDSPIPRTDLEKIKAEFEYWYPLDLLNADDSPYFSQMLHNHTAVFPKCFPRSIVYSKYPETRYYREGDLFLCPERSNSRPPERDVADVVRILSVRTKSGTNYSSIEGDHLAFELYRDLEWAKARISEMPDMRDGPPDTTKDSVFEGNMIMLVRQIDEFYKEMRYHLAFLNGFNFLNKVKFRYQQACRGPRGMNRDLLLKFLEVQAIILSPIVPHYSQHIFDLLNKDVSVQTAMWSDMKIDDLGSLQHEYMQKALHSFRKKKLSKSSEATIYVSRSFPSWINDLLECASKSTQPWGFNDIWGTYVAKYPEMTQKKIAIKHLRQAEKRCEKHGMEFLHCWPFDEIEFLQNHRDYLQEQLQVPRLTFEVIPPSGDCQVGQPSITYQT